MSIHKSKSGSAKRKVPAAKKVSNAPMLSNMPLLDTMFELPQSSGRRFQSQFQSQSHFAHICLLIGEHAIARTNLTLIVPLGTKSDLLIEQYCY